MAQPGRIPPKTEIATTKHIGRVTLDRLFSKLGIASRGVSQKWILEGRIEVNGRTTKNPNTWVSWPGDLISLDKKPLEATTQRFFLFHKPKGFITTHQDEKGRKTIFELLPPEFGFIHAVGRLDQATTGLLLLTNEPRISSFLTDPIHRIDRVYLATVRGEFLPGSVMRAMAGLMVDGELLKCESLEIQKSSRRESHLKLILREGKNREIRRLLKTLGHEVTRLRRIQFGPYHLGDLAIGKWQELPIEDALRFISISNKTVASHKKKP